MPLAPHRRSNRRASTVATGCPWIDADGRDYFASLQAMTWQVHVYGTVDESLAQWCRTKHIPLHVFKWTKEHGEAGLKCGAVYLLKPDSCVACAIQHANSEDLKTYLNKHRLQLANDATHR